MRKLMITCVIALVAMTTFAQDADNKWAVSGSLGMFEYNGEFGNEIFTFKDVNLAGGLAVSRYLCKDFDVAFDMSFGAIDFNNQGRSFSSSLRNYRIIGKFKLNNGRLIKEDALLKPYINLGFGLTHVFDVTVNSKNTFTVDQKSLENATHFNMPIGVGVSHDINEKFAAFVSTTYNYVGTDLLDGYKPNANGDKDEFFHHAIGITYKIGGKKDSDKDGVIDELDRCPDVVGLVNLYGCPDYDGDGVSDLDDLCPTSPGLADMGGCPDQDNDGISDKDDACPQMAGTKETNGCPDTDGDGVADHEDACVDVAGNKSAAGCPDIDVDGVADTEDSCPTVFGVAEKAGCPMEPIKNFKTVTNINFGTGNSSLTASAKKDLRDIATILNSNPGLKLMIEGHTDNDGEEILNRDLSAERSVAVKAYLIENGVSTSVLNASKYGESAPLVPNNTEVGKAKNRRVVVKVID
jgi:OOP family OmpA-OmpF porin